MHRVRGTKLVRASELLGRIGVQIATTWHNRATVTACEHAGGVFVQTTLGAGLTLRRSQRVRVISATFK